MHELGHAAAGILVGWQPQISFERGGAVTFAAHADPPAIATELFTLACGPLTTFALAGLSIWLLARAPKSLPLLVFAIWNTVFRFTVLIDGPGADEAKMSALVGVPYLFEAVSVVVCVGLAWALLHRQSWRPVRTWALIGLIPVSFVLFAVSYVASLKVLAAVLG